MVLMAVVWRIYLLVLELEWMSQVNVQLAQVVLKLKIKKLVAELKWEIL